MRSKIFLFLIIFLIIVIYRNWFQNSSLSAGDWGYLFSSDLMRGSLLPYVWDYNFFNGLGGNISFILGLNKYFQLSRLLTQNGIEWWIVERVMWFCPYLVVSFIASWYFSKTILEKNSLKLISLFIFLFNSYGFSLIGGGQMGVAIGYAITPLIFAELIRIIRSYDVKNSLMLGLFLSLQILFDMRMGYVSLVGISLSLFVYGLFFFRINKLLRNFSQVLIIPLGISICINAFWLLSAFLYGDPIDDLGSVYSSFNAVEFFSFATLEQSLSLLHPLWPENIFGKVGFMKPEFIIIPIIAFSSLLFIHKEQKEKRMIILYFALVGLIGAFLSKGANDPFGEVYLWLFGNIPGFVMFRDPTKWYLLTILSYSVLIPFALLNVSGQLSRIKYALISKNASLIVGLLFISFWVFTIREAILGQLGGTFQSSEISQEYKELEEFISKDENFYRTFWVPATQRFGFSSEIHPSISGRDFIYDYNPYAVVDYLKKNNSLQQLQESAVKYVIVPYDSEGEIFLRDREYDERQYKMTIARLSEINWLERIEGFGRVAVFEIPSPKGHFWSPSENLKINYHYINPTRYKVRITGANQGDSLIFSESYDPQWYVRRINGNYSDKHGMNRTISSNPYDKKLNSFTLDEGGSYELEVFYLPQKYVNIGLLISGVTVIVLVSFIVMLYRKR